MPDKKFLPIILVIALFGLGFIVWQSSRVEDRLNTDDKSIPTDTGDWQYYNHQMFYFKYPANWISINNYADDLLKLINFYADDKFRMNLTIYSNKTDAAGSPSNKYESLDQYVDHNQIVGAEDISLRGYPAKYFLQPTAENNIRPGQVYIFAPDDSLIISLIYYPESESDETFKQILDTFRFMDPEAG